MAMTIDFLPSWPPANLTLLWIALAVLGAALAGEVARAWLRLPRIAAYTVVGMGIGALAGRNVLDLDGEWLRRAVELALAIVLFELGNRVNLRWLRANPWIVVASLAECGASFAAVYGVALAFDLPRETALLLGALGVSTSPAVVMRVVAETRAQGLISDRLLVHSALNTIIGVLLLHFLVGATGGGDGNAFAAYAYPLYLVAGALLVGAILALSVRLLQTWLPSRDEYGALTLLGVMLMTVAGVEALHLSVLLTLLCAGMALRNAERRVALLPGHFSTVGGILVIVLFLVSGMWIQPTDLTQGGLLLLALLGARFLAKAAVCIVLARPSGLSWKQGLALGVSLSPWSGLLMITATDLRALYPVFNQVLIPAVLGAVAVMGLLGPVLVALCLKWGGEERVES